LRVEKIPPIYAVPMHRDIGFWLTIASDRRREIPPIYSADFFGFSLAKQVYISTASRAFGSNVAASRAPAGMNPTESKETCGRWGMQDSRA
jgi:hypothetical protein